MDFVLYLRREFTPMDFSSVFSYLIIEYLNSSGKDGHSVIFQNNRNKKQPLLVFSHLC